MQAWVSPGQERRESDKSGINACSPDRTTLEATCKTFKFSASSRCSSSSSNNEFDLSEEDEEKEKQVVGAVSCVQTAQSDQFDPGIAIAASPIDDDKSFRFLLDSGNLLHHATPHGEIVAEVESISNTAGKTIDGTSLSVVGAGTVPDTIIDRVYIIPELDQAVLSVHQLANQGYTSVFPSTSQGGGALVLNSDSKVVASAGDDYTIDIRQVKVIAAVFNKNDPQGLDAPQRVQLLQRRLQGLNKATVLQIAKGGLIKNLPCSYEDIKVYWTDDGTQKAGTIPRRSARLRPKDYNRGQPGDHVHFDAFTVSPPAMLHKYDLVYVFVDRASLQVIVLFGRRKDKSVDVAQHIWRIDRIFRLHGHKILSMQSDNFSTYVAQEVQDAEWAMGIRRVLKPPYLKEGLEEDMVHALKNIVRVSFAAAPYVPASCWPYAVLLAVELLGLKPAPNSETISRFFAFTGVHPDWSRMPLDYFGAPYIVWESKDQREHTFSGSGEWAAYLCPSADSLPEVHYFLLFKGKNQYSVVLRGSYERQARVPDAWWSNISSSNDVKIRVAGGNFCKEIDGRAFLSFNCHYPLQGLVEQGTQTEPAIPICTTRDLHEPVEETAGQFDNKKVVEESTQLQYDSSQGTSYAKDETGSTDTYGTSSSTDVETISDLEIPDKPVTTDVGVQTYTEFRRQNPIPQSGKESATQARSNELTSPFCDTTHRWKLYLLHRFKPTLTGGALAVSIYSRKLTLKRLRHQPMIYYDVHRNKSVV